MNTLAIISRFSTIPVNFILIVYFPNARLLSSVEMEAARQRVRAAVAHKKKEERRAKGKEGASWLTLKAVSKGSAKRKANGKDNRPPKKAAITPKDAHTKKKSPLKSSRGVSKGMMTSTGPVVEGPRRLLTYKDYAVEEVVRVKALQDRCIAKEGVVTLVRKRNTNLLNEQEQYKDALYTLNSELKETKEKLEEAGHPKETLQGELSTLHE